MNARLASLALLLFLPLPGAWGQVAPLDRVPIRYVRPTLVVEARVNNSPPLRFAFDTGATTVVLDTRVARRLAIRPGAGQRFARIRTLAVGRAVAYDLEAALGDLSNLSRQLGLELAGILGYTWMEQFIFEIDYAAGQLTLWPRQAELPLPADTLAVPMEIQTAPGFTGSALFVFGRLNRTHGCRFEIDTGTDIGILGAALARRLGAMPAPGEKRGTAPELRSPYLYHAETLELGGRLFAHVPFRIDAARGADGHPYLQCVIGNEQLKEFVLTLDIPHRRALFRPAPRPASPP